MADTTATEKKSAITIKVTMAGDAAVGKTSFMARFVEGNYNEDYVETLGVNFMNKTIKFFGREVVFSVWDLGGQRDFRSMLPIVCADSAVIFYMFDLTRKTTLSNVKQWFKQCSALNRKAYPFLVGTKYDAFLRLDKKEQELITKVARRYAKVMKSPLIFCSAADDVNVRQIFKVVLGRVFRLMEKMRIPKKSEGALLEF